jgi:hypothetical protein
VVKVRRIAGSTRILEDVVSSLRIPGILGARGSGSAELEDGTLPRVEMPQPGVVGTWPLLEVGPLDIPTEVDMDKVIAHLDKKAHATYETAKGQCARYVREALEAGGAQIVARQEYGKDYGKVMDGIPRYSKIDAAGYVPQRGDVAVLQPPSGKTAGHVQIYNGTQWVSDFKQEGFYPGPAYRNEKVSYEIYRHGAPPLQPAEPDPPLP